MKPISITILSVLLLSACTSSSPSSGKKPDPKPQPNPPYSNPNYGSTDNKQPAIPTKHTPNNAVSLSNNAATPTEGYTDISSTESGILDYIGNTDLNSLKGKKKVTLSSSDNSQTIYHLDVEDNGYFQSQQGNNISVGWKQGNSYIYLISPSNSDNDIFTFPAAPNTKTTGSSASDTKTVNVPASGTAKYIGYALGAVSLNRAGISKNEVGIIKGTSNIDINFGDKSVTGNIDFTDNPTYKITLSGQMETATGKSAEYKGTATVQGGGSGTFSGTLLGDNHAQTTGLVIIGENTPHAYLKKAVFIGTKQTTEQTAGKTTEPATGSNSK